MGAPRRGRCVACGAQTPRWLGRCPACGAWGTVEEGPTDRPAVAGEVRPITDVAATAGPRRPTGIGELDRVLGGGLVPGSVTLLAGEPGLGKSTLALQALGALAAAGSRGLLVGAEESPEQVRQRAERVGALHPELLLVAEPSLEAIVDHVEAHAPAVLAVDSIQTVARADRPGAPGSATQVREGAQDLVRLARRRACPTLLVGHVTKDGTVAGPRTLEHVVDTVLTVEGDHHHGLRLLRARKHRFGSTRELGVLELGDTGLVEVPDPSALFLQDRRPGTPGSAVAAVLDGARPLLVEVQALVAAGGPTPRRFATGFDAGRLTLTLAVLEQRGGVGLGGAEVYASVAGGVRVTEPGLDLAVALAVAGARLGHAVDPHTVAVGELGLGGELRQVPGTPVRLAEAARLGFRRVVGPPRLPETPGLETVPVASLADALAASLHVPQRHAA
jgi:DNA repair protein RadA/Sms